MAKPEKHVFICAQSRPPNHPRGSCGHKGSSKVLEEFSKQFEQRQLWSRFALTQSGCLGPCDQGANVLVYPDSVLYGPVTSEDVATIIDEHLLDDKPVGRLRVPAEVW